MHVDSTVLTIPLNGELIPSLTLTPDGWDVGNKGSQCIQWQQ